MTGDTHSDGLLPAHDAEPEINGPRRAVSIALTLGGLLVLATLIFGHMAPARAQNGPATTPTPGNQCFDPGMNCIVSVTITSRVHGATITWSTTRTETSARVCVNPVNGGNPVCQDNSQTGLGPFSVTFTGLRRATAYHALLSADIDYARWWQGNFRTRR